ncbi:MAG: SOS response-associated peptidase [Vulcanimicrobiaceae bacterium]
MCGRFTLHSAQLERWLERNLAFRLRTPWVPRYNLAPTDQALVAPNDGLHEARSMRWGLLSPWTRGSAGGRPLINARRETLAEKPAFRDALATRRCLVIADGYFEWQARERGPKQPHYIRLPGGEPFAFAGLWARERLGETDAPVESCAIVTCDADGPLRAIHSRMPVALPRERWMAWLDPQPLAPDASLPILEALAGDAFEAIPISTRVNHIEDDDPAVLVPLSLDGSDANVAAPAARPNGRQRRPRDEDHPRLF